jgi:cofilin
MAMSGVSVADACVKQWEALKGKKIKACCFKLSPKATEIVPDEDSVISVGTADAWKAFTNGLPDKECRYAIYDIELSLDLGPGVPPGTRTKLAFIVWSPQGAPIRQKMISASSKEALKKKLDGIQVTWQLTDRDELEASDRISDLSVLPDIKTSGNGILTFEDIKA